MRYGFNRTSSRERAIKQIMLSFGSDMGIGFGATFNYLKNRYELIKVPKCVNKIIFRINARF